MTQREVPVAWEALEDAFENNASEVHSFLHLETGDVTRIVDGVAEPEMHRRIARDPMFKRIDPVSSREQYRWMERFIDTVEEPDLHEQLTASIDGKGAFRRFKDVLMTQPVDRERWFTFRSERLRACMEAWLAANDYVPVARPEWTVPTAEEVTPRPPEQERGQRTRAAIAEVQRARIHEFVDLLPGRDLESALAFIEFLRERRHLPRTRAKRAEPGSGEGDSTETDDARDHGDDDAAGERAAGDRAAADHDA